MICVKCRVEADAIMENLKFFKEITKMKQVSYKTLQALKPSRKQMKRVKQIKQTKMSC